MKGQKGRKNLIDDILPVDSAGKLICGQLSALYLWCALFKIMGNLMTVKSGKDY